jgi:D-inositol-3-phosphate glycosyltransferase
MSNPTKQQPAHIIRRQLYQPFPIAEIQIPTRQPIALISEPGDPAAEIGKDAAGGQNVYVRQVGEALAKLGWQVDMFTRKSNPEDANIVQHTPYCRTIRLVAGPQTYMPRDKLFAYMPEFVAAFQKFQQQEGNNYPLIHTHDWMSGWVGLQLQQQQNVQLIHTYHSLGAVKYQPLTELPTIAKTRLAVECQLLAQSHRVVATSPQKAEDLQQLGSQLGRVEIIPCGTDVQNFRPIAKAEARKQLGLNPQDRIVLYVGRFDPRKGIETLVRACAQLRSHDDSLVPSGNLRLVIVGGSDSQSADGAERQRIEGIVDGLGLTAVTQFVGMVGQDRLPRYYTAADVCVIPSHYEAFGLVAIEAMACGTPVVASAVGGLKFTVIPGETGLLVPAQDIAGFAKAIGRILNEESWMTKIRDRATARVQANFRWGGVAVQLSDLYRRLLAQSLLNPVSGARQLTNTSNTSIGSTSVPHFNRAKPRSPVLQAASIPNRARFPIGTGR